jgi:hypothetical protein
MMSMEHWGNEWQGKSNTWKRTAPVPICQAQIPHDLIWAPTLAAEVKADD